MGVTLIAAARNRRDVGKCDGNDFKEGNGISHPPSARLFLTCSEPPRSAMIKWLCSCTGCPPSVRTVCRKKKVVGKLTASTSLNPLLANTTTLTSTPTTTHSLTHIPYLIQRQDDEGVGARAALVHGGGGGALGRLAVAEQFVDVAGAFDGDAGDALLHGAGGHTVPHADGLK